MNDDDWKLVDEGSEIKLNAKSQWILDFYCQHKHPPNAIEYRDEWSANSRRSNSIAQYLAKRIYIQC